MFVLCRLTLYVKITGARPFVYLMSTSTFLKYTQGRLLKQLIFNDVTLLSKCPNTITFYTFRLIKRSSLKNQSITTVPSITFEYLDTAVSKERWAAWPMPSHAALHSVTGNAKFKNDKTIFIFKKTVSRDGFGFWWHAWSVNDFIRQKVYFSPIYRVWVGLIILAACT